LCDLFSFGCVFFFFQAEDGIRDRNVTGVQTCALPISRHHDGDPVSGELFHERVEPFPGRCAWERYAAARRRTSTSCSRSLFRLRSSRSSAFSDLVKPGFCPCSTRSSLSHLLSVLTWIPKSFAICASVSS